MNWYEVNFDGLVGPTHNYAGLSYGNLASQKNRNLDSRPRQAALQGLKKMRLLYDLGIEQAILPPHLRPDLGFLRRVGFQGSSGSQGSRGIQGSPGEITEEIAKEIMREATLLDPTLLASASSSAFMWAANAATVTPSPDSQDQLLHLTPANLLSGIHRSIESQTTYRILKSIFPCEEVLVHQALPGSSAMSDEGAANHMRLTGAHGQPGLEIFVYGADGSDPTSSAPGKYPARQSLQASQAIARLHRVNPERLFFWKQNPDAIDQGAFHNDVVAVANQNVLFCHQQAFENQPQLLPEVAKVFENLFSDRLYTIEVSCDELSLAEAVDTYLFNSQLVSISPTEMALVAPRECQESTNAMRVIDNAIKSDNPISQVLFPDVRQSMRNGGGPACLRLRIVMNEQQLQQMHQPVRFSPELETTLTDWIHQHYREVLSPDDLGNPQLYFESREALFRLEEILDFQVGTLVPK